MIPRQPWFERKFPSGLPANVLPIAVERLRGTPARLQFRLAEVPQSTFVRRIGETWSIQENVGHLLDLEPLWRQRVAELAARKSTLVEADLINRRTHEANHNAGELKDLLRQFQTARAELVAMIESFSDDAVAFTAIHPRLKTPMSVVDLSHFVAEHDDYHLARISELLREFNS